MKRKEYIHPQIIAEHMQFCYMIAESNGNQAPVNPNDPVPGEPDAKMFGGSIDFEDEDY